MEIFASKHFSNEGYYCFYLSQGHQTMSALLLLLLKLKGAPKLQNGSKAQLELILGVDFSIGNSGRLTLKDIFQTGLQPPQGFCLVFPHT